MWKDPIVEEVRRIREQHAAELGNDLHKICEHYRTQQQKSGHQVIKRPARPTVHVNIA